MTVLEKKIAEIIATDWEHMVVPTWGGPQKPAVPKPEDTVLEATFAEFVGTNWEHVVVPTWGGRQEPAATEQDDAAPARPVSAMRYPEWHARLTGSNRTS